MQQNLKTQIVTKLKISNGDQTEKDTNIKKLKQKQNSKTQIVTKPKNSVSDKTKKVKI